MSEENRGEIRNRAAAQQLRNFKGLRFGKITPTDIDMFIDFGDKIFIIGEGKLEGHPMPFGQRLALERLCDRIWKGGAISYALLIEHNDSMKNQNGDIDYDKTIVKSYRFEGLWKDTKARLTTLEIIHKILLKHNWRPRE